MTTILGYLLQSTAQALHFIFVAMQIVIIVRALLSWVSADPFNPIVRLIVQASEPILRPFQRLPLVFAGIDFTPMAALVAIVFLDSFLPPLLMHWAASLLYG